MSTQAPIRTEQSPTTSTPTTPPPATPPPARRPGTGNIIVGVLLIALGAIWLLDALGVAIPLGMLVPIILITLGLAVAISGVLGHHDGVIGLAVFLGVVLAAGSIVVSVLDVPVAGGAGDRVYAPTTAADLEDAYGVFAGTVTLDLQGLELAPGTTEVAVTTVLGEVEVVVPEGMTIDVDASAAGGTLDLFGATTEGLGLSDEHTSAGYEDARRRLHLELRAGLGEVRLVATD